jgi:nitrogen fixation/metabolism regulation signal transduction histidine kinase
VTPRARFTAYLVFVHLLLAGTGVALWWQTPELLVVIEAVIIVSAIAGIALTRRLLRTLGDVKAGALLIQDGDFTSRLLPVGQPEVDALTSVYNRLVDSLRDERTRLQEQQHFLADVLRFSPSGIVVLDFDGRIASVNPAAERLLGDAGTRCIGARLTDLGSRLPTVVATLAAGTTLVIDVDGARRLRCHHGTFLDRSFRRSFILIEELTDELRQAERSAYEKLIRVMAHEVNNSVTASNSLLTSSLTYGAELSAESRSDFDRAIGIVIQRTAQLNQFMRTFADVFRLPAPFKHPERVVDVLEGTVRLVSARPDAATVAWTWDVDDATLTVPMDRGQMEQALLNVLQNAIDAQARTIAVRLQSRNGGRPTLRIEDSGEGFGPEAQSNLFTPFFSTKPNGQGIGLTLVREILSAHGFDYSLHKEPGQPTTFTIVF